MSFQFFCGLRANCSPWGKFTSQDSWFREQTSCRERGWGPGSGGSTHRWWSTYGEFSGMQKWICLHLIKQPSVSLTQTAPLGTITKHFWPPHLSNTARQQSVNNQASQQSGFKKGHCMETTLLSVCPRPTRPLCCIWTTRSCCPLSPNWASLVQHSTGSTLISQAIKVSWRGETSSRISSCFSPLFYINHLHGSNIKVLIPIFANDMQLYFFCQMTPPCLPVSLLAFRTSLLGWKRITYNLSKTELLVIPAHPLIQHHFTVQLGSSTITSTKFLRNLGMFDYELKFTSHITATTQICRYVLYNIRKIISRLN